MRFKLAVNPHAKLTVSPADRPDLSETKGE